MKYNSIAVLGFTFEHDSEDPYDTPINNLRRRLLSRIADLDEHDSWFDALDFNDTVEGALHED